MKFFLKVLKKALSVFSVNNSSYLILNHIESEKREVVLVVYLTPNVLFSHTKKINHSNRNDFLEIINYFTQNDFEVHIVGCLDKNADLKKDTYSYVFGLGDNYYKALELNPKAKKILYCTESSPNFSLAMEKKRVDSFNKTYGRNKAKLIRSGVYLTNEMLIKSDVALIIGNEDVIKTYDYVEKDSKLIGGVYPSALMNKSFISSDVTHNFKNSFLWFGSTGAIHKGLHLAIEAIIKRPDLKLYIAGINDSDKSLMPKSDNVIYVGRVDVGSEDFLQLIKSVSSFILPSCSEAGSTATTTCLCHGLIPIVTKEVGVDLPTGFSYLPNDSSCEIIKMIDDVTNYSNEDVVQMRDKIAVDSRVKYSITAYRTNIKRILDAVVQ